MNAKKLIAAVAMIAAAGSVFAADNTEFVEFTHVQPVKTRAEVRAELQQAYAQGTLGHNSEFVEFTHVASAKSRDEVRKEAIQAAKTAGNNTYFGG
ncbi:MAG TPA: DUF4148 domain-containing protein [Noviherbaspirillum sp.]